MNSVKSALTYRKLSDSVFFWTSTILHATVLTLALTVTDLGLVFEIGGSIGVAGLFFFFPGIAFLLALNRYGNSHIRQKWDTTCFLVLAWFFIFLSLLSVGSFFWLQFFKLSGRIGTDDETVVVVQVHD